MISFKIKKENIFSDLLITKGFALLKHFACSVFDVFKGEWVGWVKNVKMASWMPIWIHPLKYVTFGCCSILRLWKFITNVPIFFFLFLVGKRIDTVLSSPKWMVESLLSTHQSHITKFFSSLFIWSSSLCWCSKHCVTCIKK